MAFIEEVGWGGIAFGVQRGAKVCFSSERERERGREGDREGGGARLVGRPFRDVALEHLDQPMPGRARILERDFWDSGH